ncbi:hypothetical protein K7X08_022049 [Anisodus acutangulus]|uniref:Uncharacterized protein n=1 Tax=Anisodus acutangulus TaxID=402998 RepID=A0A9Q1L368_9SOLA|nr:hypothetical protein K7X08_022049 [Anisodus acutangulus]
MLSHFPAASSESFEPTDMLVRVRPEFLWYRHLKEPTCVVGEHKQLYFTLDVFSRVVGEEGVEDGIGAIAGCGCSAILQVDSAEEINIMDKLRRIFMIYSALPFFLSWLSVL